MRGIPFYISVWLFCFSFAHARENALCPLADPQQLSPTFVLTSYEPGQLQSICEQSLKNGLAKGFTSVSFLPTFRFDPKKNKLTDADKNIKPGELSYCLDLAWKMGFDIVYQPHLESAPQIGEWRAHFPYKPDPRSRSILFTEVLRWLESHQREINENKASPFTIVYAAEIETSVDRYAKEWLAVLKYLRAEFKKRGLESDAVKLGIGPNWGPLDQPIDSCPHFRALIAASDFVAPSFYGDWSDFEEEGQADRHRLDVLSRVQNRRDRLQRECFIHEYAERPFGVVEFGVGLDPSRSYEVMSQEKDLLFESAPFDTYLEDRAQIYRSVFDWAKSGPQRGDFPLPLIFWSMGFFDPFQIDPNNHDAINDPELENLLRSYNLSRCSHQEKSQ